MRSRRILLLVAAISALVVTAAAAAPLGDSSRNCGQLPNGGYCSLNHEGIVEVRGNANNPAGSVQCYVFFAGGGDEGGGVSKPTCAFKPSQHAGDEGRVYNRHGSSEEVGIAIAW